VAASLFRGGLPFAPLSHENGGSLFSGSVLSTHYLLLTTHWRACGSVFIPGSLSSGSVLSTHYLLLTRSYLINAFLGGHGFSRAVNGSEKWALAPEEILRFLPDPFMRQVLPTTHYSLFTCFLC
jgi:hypothetical protein